MLPNKRLKLAALLLKEALCCLVFEMSAAAKRDPLGVSLEINDGRDSAVRAA
jgi:hypothetical protein